MVKDLSLSTALRAKGVWKILIQSETELLGTRILLMYVHTTALTVTFLGANCFSRKQVWSCEEARSRTKRGKRNRKGLQLSIPWGFCQGRHQHHWDLPQSYRANLAKEWSSLCEQSRKEGVHHSLIILKRCKYLCSSFEWINDLSCLLPPGIETLLCRHGNKVLTGKFIFNDRQQRSCTSCVTRIGR